MPVPTVSVSPSREMPSCKARSLIKVVVKVTPLTSSPTFNVTFASEPVIAPVSTLSLEPLFVIVPLELR